MNLVVLEYVAAQQRDNPGVVLVSEFTGAKSLLPAAIGINPRDTIETANTLYAAMNMPKVKRQLACEKMQGYLRHYTATDWCKHFFDALKNINLSNEAAQPSLIRNQQDFLSRTFSAKGKKSWLIFLDYDGTLVDLCPHPQEALLTEKGRSLLSFLSQQPHVKVVVVSGRDQAFLAEQFSGLNICLAAEYGAFYFDGHAWSSFITPDDTKWYDDAFQIMSTYVKRTPASFVETKNVGLVWHYRRSPLAPAKQQSRALYDALTQRFSSSPVSVLQGKKVIEVCALKANKSTFVSWFLTQNQPVGCGLVFGDDLSDEGMFMALAHKGFATIKVGEGQTMAKYRLSSPAEVLSCLKEVCLL